MQDSTEVKPAEEVVETTQQAAVETTEPVQTDTPAEEPVSDEPEKKIYTSKKEVIERLKDIVASDDVPAKAEVEHLKSVFYRLHFAEREAQQK